MCVKNKITCHIPYPTNNPLLYSVIPFVSHPIAWSMGRFPLPMRVGALATARALLGGHPLTGSCGDSKQWGEMPETDSGIALNKKMLDRTCHFLRYRFFCSANHDPFSSLHFDRCRALCWR